MKKSLILTLFAALALTSSSYSQSFTTIYAFADASGGSSVNGTPYIDAGGVLYFTAGEGGTGAACLDGCGTVVSVIPAVPPSTSWTESTIYTFQGTPDGAYPESGLIQGPGGTLIGTTYEGGATVNAQSCPAGCGVAFQLTPPADPGGAWTDQTLLNYPAANYNPLGLVMGPNGVLYGAATYGGRQQCQGDDGIGCGLIYEVQPPSLAGGSWTSGPIYKFSGGLRGEFPNSPLVLSANGALYGTFVSGGAGSNGGVFSLAPTQVSGDKWSASLLYSFETAIRGAAPEAGMVAGPNGVLYGSTASGGPGCGTKGCFGTVFSMTPPAQAGESWKKTGLYAFKGGVSDGSLPQSFGTNPAVNTDGSIYGVTTRGGGTGCGGEGCGILFKLSPPDEVGGAWTETILHIFTGGADGQNPQFAPAIDPNGVLYGVAGGGAGTACFGIGCGVVYQYVP
jgi:hypothetical protein